MVTEDDVRRVALSLLATTEKQSYGMPGFRVKDKLFARIREEGAERTSHHVRRGEGVMASSLFNF